MYTTAIIMAVIGYIGIVFKQLPQTLFELYKEVKWASISILSTDNIEGYMKLNKWLLSLNKKCFTNNINLKTTWNDEGENIIVSTLNYGSYVIKLEKFTYAIITKSYMEKNRNDAGYRNATNDRMDIVIIGHGKNKYVNLINDIVKEKEMDESKTISVYPCASIYYHNKIMKKSFDDIFIKDKDIIINYIDKWVSMSDKYYNHGITYKTGILLYGEPGTGKTTVARAIASYLDYKLHIINLKSFKNDEDYIERITEIPKKSVVLFEDIDCVVSSRDNEDSTEIQKYRIGLLLNTLDGVLSPNQTIFIATTNHIDRLDPAITREGRFDLKVNVSNIDRNLAEQMCKRYNTSIDLLEGEKFPINPAYLQSKIFK